MGTVHPKANIPHGGFEGINNQEYNDSRQDQPRNNLSLEDLKIAKAIKKVSDSHFSLEGNKDRYFNHKQLGEISEKFPEYKAWMEQSIIMKNKRSKPKTKKLKWKEGEIIGRGSCGNVRIGLNLETGSIMAVKQVELMNKTSRIQQDRIESLEVEIELLSKFSHKNIVKYFGLSRTKDTLNIFLEYISGGSIASMVKKFGPLNTNIIRFYTKQILEGLEYLHVRNTIHRDIKGANILVDHNGVCKLTDFGTATKLYSIMENEDKSKLIQEIKGTLNWMAPECLKQKTLGRQCDIWGVGCTVLEMATGQPPWADILNRSDAINKMSLLYRIGKAKSPPPIPENLDPEMIDFLHCCFKVNPYERLNVSELLNHPFIAKIPSEQSPIRDESRQLNPVEKKNNSSDGSGSKSKRNQAFFPNELKGNCSVVEYLNKCRSVYENSPNISKELSPKSNLEDDDKIEWQTPEPKEQNSRCLELFESHPDSEEMEEVRTDEKMIDYAHFRMNSINQNKSRSRGGGGGDTGGNRSPRSYKSKISRQNTETYSDSERNKLGSEESVLPPKSMFGLMLMRKKESTNPNFCKNLDKFQTETALPEIVENRYGQPTEDGLLPLPRYLFMLKSNSGEVSPPGWAEKDKSTFMRLPQKPSSFFTQIREEEDRKSPSLEDFEEDTISPGPSDQVQKSLEELEDFNLQEDLEGIYKQIDATEVTLK